MGKSVLIVDDEKTIVDIVTYNLQREGYETWEAYDGEKGMELVREKNPDLLLLDVMLPKQDGFSVCRTLRAEGVDTPILMLTAREDESDKVLGLEIGADDYITKPFSMRELLARVKANMRRTVRPEEPEEMAADTSPAVRVGPLVWHEGRMEIRKYDTRLELSQREYELLYFLMTHSEQVFSREELMQRVWNYEYYGDLRTVDVTVRRLREKIEDTPGEPVLLLTRRGSGYLLTGG